MNIFINKLKIMILFQDKKKIIVKLNQANKYLKNTDFKNKKI
jgi:hypothetical protein